MNTPSTPAHNRADLQAAIARRRPSRLPYTYEAQPEAEQRLREYLGLAADVTVEAHFGCNVFAHAWELLGWNRPRLPEREQRLAAAAPPDVTVDIWGRQTCTVVENGVRQSRIVFCPLATAETIADVERFDWPRVEEVVFPKLPPQFDPQAAKADRVTWLWGYTNLFSLAWSMRGMDTFMLDLALNPGMVEAMLSRIADYYYACLEQFFERYPGLIELVRSSDDWGSQQGLLISPEMAERFFMPHYRRLLELAARHGALGYQHSCGGIRQLIPPLIEAGVRILNPIQAAAVGMEPAALKRDFGRDLCFHGGMDTQGSLLSGAPQDVRREVRRLADDLGPDGFIAAPAHVLQPDVPPQNIVAMYEELREDQTGTP